MTQAARHSGNWLKALQVALVIVLLFGDIGFDTPGRYGLASGTLLLCVGGLVLASLILLVGCARKGAWGAALAHFSFPFLVIGGLFVLEDARTRAAYIVFDSAEYQHLIGKTLEEVNAEIGSPPGITQATFIEADGERVELQCPGMTVRFSPAGIALEVLATER